MRAAERIGLYVARLRKARGMTDHRDLATAANMSPTTVRSVERGKNWTIDTLERVAEALSVPVDELLCPEDEHSPEVLELHSALRTYIQRGDPERELMLDLLSGLLRQREAGREEPGRSEPASSDHSTK